MPQRRWVPRRDDSPQGVEESRLISLRRRPSQGAVPSPSRRVFNSAPTAAKLVRRVRAGFGGGQRWGWGAVSVGVGMRVRGGHGGWEGELCSRSPGCGGSGVEWAGRDVAGGGVVQSERQGGVCDFLHVKK